jgi:hypothetical protein
MKKITLIGAFMALMMLGNRSMAQSRLTPEQMKEMKEKFNDFKTKLNLSDDQAPKVKAIDSAYFEGITALKDPGGSRLSKFRKFKNLSTDRDKQMKEVLNKDQFAQYQKFKTEMKDEFKANRNN